MNIIKRLAILLTFVRLTLGGYSQNTAEELYKKAKHYDSIGSIENAIKLYTSTIEKDSLYKNAYFNRASLNCEQGFFDKALIDFLKFDKLSPDDFETLYLLAFCYYKLNNYERSLFYANKTLLVSPNYFDALKLKGVMELYQKKYALAISSFKNAAINSEDSELYSLMGSAYENVPNIDSALICYTIAEQKGYQHVLLYNNLGSIYYTKGNLSKSLLYFEKALILDPTFVEGYYHKGKVLSKLGFTAGATENWKKAKSLGYTNFTKEELEAIK